MIMWKNRRRNGQERFNRIEIYMEDILKKYLNLTSAKVSFQTLTSGHINKTVEATLSYPTHTVSYILQRINTDIFPKPQDIMENIETVAKHLEAKNYPRPILKCMPLLDNNGFLVKIDSKLKTQNLSANKAGSKLENTEGPLPKQNTENEGTWRVVYTIENSFSILIVDNTEQAYDAAFAFGEYGRNLSDLEVSKIHTIIPRFHDADLRIEQFRTALKRGSSLSPVTTGVLRFEKAKNDLIFIQKHIPFFENKKLDIPLRVTHNDTKISNILFDKTTLKPSCIIDIDTLQPSTILSDFGDMVRAYTPNMGEDDPNLKDLTMRFDFFKSMTAGFLDGLKDALTPNEKAALIFGAKRTIFVQALRFMSDYLNNDVYYKTHYDDHNLIRAQNQLALYQSILTQEKEMERFILEGK
jgi:thiamine kinase-like enzyme